MIDKDQNPNVIHTKLKFVKSEVKDAYISFVSINKKTGRVKGVRQDSKYEKKVCILDKVLSQYVIPNALYDATIVPMKSERGYVATQINLVKFNATVEVTYVPKAVYSIDVKFGNKDIRFNPLDGKKDSVKYFDECLEVIKQCVDIRNLDEVVDDFTKAATQLLRQYENDGYYVAKKHKAS